MKRHTSILLIAGLCLMALFSCKPVEYPTALERTAVTDSPQIYVTPHAKKADVAFTPVKNADSYSITLQYGEGEASTINVPIKVKEGLCTFTVRKLDPESEYTLTVTASNTQGSKASSHIFKTTEDNGELDYAPVAYMSKRDETTATITVNKRKGIEYRVSFNRDGIWEILEEDSENPGTYNITGLDNSKSYDAKVEHRKVNTTIYSSDITELVIPKDRKAFDPDLTFTLEGSSIVMEDTRGKDYMTLLFYPDGSGVPIKSDTINTSASRSIDISVFGPFTSGLFDVVLSDSPTDEHMIFSQPQYLTTPAMPQVDTSASNQKSVTLTWTQPEGMEDIIYTVYGESDDSYRWQITPAEVEVSGTRATLRLDDLVSNTAYTLNIEAELPNGESCMTVCRFTTESFSGVYRWVCPTSDEKVSSFVIEVWDKDIATKKIEKGEWKGKWNDDFPYHVFVHESDPAYNDSMKGVPIMPLFQGNDEIPSGTISYADGNQHYQIGYRWNEAKWNKTTKRPVKWKPTQNIISADHIESFCDSWPVVFGKEIQVSTKTTFEFRIKDGKAQLVFRNAGDGPTAGTVNIGLFTNPKPEAGTDKYTFILDRIGSVE